jgi:hypothetical protein
LRKYNITVMLAKIARPLDVKTSKVEKNIQKSNPGLVK